MLKNSLFLNYLNNKKILPAIVFLIFFIIGVSSYSSYGISIDEPFHRLMGFYWLDYILQFFPHSEISQNVNLILNNIKVSSFEDISRLEPNDFVYGIIFDTPLALIETLFKIEDSKSYFQIRHLFNFLIFFISSVYFYKILLLRSFQWHNSLFGTLFYILSPRIFANSFYNNKDLIFLSLFVISIYYTFKLLKNINIYNSFCFAFFVALSTSSRIIGIVTIIIYFFIFSLSIVSFPDIYIKKLKYLIFIIVFYFLTLFFLWPYLWSSPFENLINALEIFSNYPRYMYVLYDSIYIKTSSLPWHYSIKWIFITTPLLYLFFLLIGLSFILYSTSVRFLNIKENSNEYDFWSNSNEKLDFFIFIYLSSFLFFIIYSETVLYNGWRQLYFLHPLIIYISTLGFCKIRIMFFNDKGKFLFLFTIIFYLTYVGSQIFIMHPYQNVYFNYLSGKQVHKKFDVDYWGLANKRFLESIALSELDKDQVNIAASSFTTLDRSIDLLDIKFRKKFNIVGQEYDEAKYIFTNFMSDINRKIEDKYDIPSNFKLYEEFEVNGIKLYEVYKKIN